MVRSNRLRAVSPTGGQLLTVPLKGVAWETTTRIIQGCPSSIRGHRLTQLKAGAEEAGRTDNRGPTCQRCSAGSYMAQWAACKVMCSCCSRGESSGPIHSHTTSSGLAWPGSCQMYGLWPWDSALHHRSGMQGSLSSGKQRIPGDQICKHSTACRAMEASAIA